VRPACLLNPVRNLIRLALWTWFLAALVVGRLGLLKAVPAPSLSGVLLGLTVLLLAACTVIPAIRTWLETVDLNALVLLHVSRLIGYAFLVLFRQGRLPYALAVTGGWGEIVAGALALVAVFLPMRASLRRHAFIIWNTIGLANVLLLAATVVRIEFILPWQLGALRFLPGSMLPTFLMPLIIVTHIVLYGRLRAPAGTSDPKAPPPADV